MKTENTQEKIDTSMLKIASKENSNNKISKI